MLEQHGLALHDRHRGQGSDIAQAEHGRAIADDGDRVAPGGIPIGEVGIGGNGGADSSHPWGVEKCQILARVQRFGGDHRDLAPLVRDEDGIVGQLLEPHDGRDSSVLFG